MKKSHSNVYTIQSEAVDIELDSFIISNTIYLEVNWKNQLIIDDLNKMNMFLQWKNAGVILNRFYFKERF